MSERQQLLDRAKERLKNRVYRTEDRLSDTEPLIPRYRRISLNATNTETREVETKQTESVSPSSIVEKHDIHDSTVSIAESEPKTLPTTTLTTSEQPKIPAVKLKKIVLNID